MRFAVGDRRAALPGRDDVEHDAGPIIAPIIARDTP
jgi:hypothetical protein